MSKKLINNERTKLLATSVNSVGTACVTIGLLTPSAALLYSPQAFGAGVQTLTLFIGSALWIVAAIVLHIFGRYILGGLR